MSQFLVFLFGLFILILFALYFTASKPRAKRISGTLLTLVLLATSVSILSPPTKHLRFGLDLQGGTSFLIRLVPERNRPLDPDALDHAVTAIRNRIDRFGVSEPSITPRGENRILVQIPGLESDKQDDAREQLQRVAKLEFRRAVPHGDHAIAAMEGGQSILPPGTEIVTFDNSERVSSGEQILVERRIEIPGTEVRQAGAFYDAQGWGVQLSFTPEGARAFGDLTKWAYEQRSQIAILLDGKIVSLAGVTNGPIYGGSAQITGGNMTESDARGLSSALENPLQNSVVIEEERGVSPTLGADSVRNGLAAGIAGLLATLAFILIYYRLAGLIANFALVVSVVLILGAMAAFGFVLTLPGIAGIILTIGMAVDANVLIYERLREEIENGLPLPKALSAAYDKAFTAIFDSNITSLLTAGILFFLASGPVQGFAVTLGVGLIISMFTALVVTRTCFRWIVDTGFVKRMTLSNWIPNTSIDFLGSGRKITMAASALCLALTGYVTWRGEANFGVDFRGGDLLVLSSTNPIDLASARGALSLIGIGDSVVQTETSGEKEVLSIKSPSGTADRVLETMSESFPDSRIKVEQRDTVGTAVGRELAAKSATALALGLGGIFVYVAARFEVPYAIGATAALLHDVILTIGALALLGNEFSLVVVGAVLTVAGYSINDTIVIFDRIRERLKEHPETPLAEIMNRSISETLGRTLLTSVSTLLPAIALYVWGGPALHDFSLAILVGILAGCFSTIFIASPVALWLFQRKGDRVIRTPIPNC